MFPLENKTSKAVIQSYRYGEAQILSLVVSEHCANLALRLHNSTSFQLIFANDMSKSKL